MNNATPNVSYGSYRIQIVLGILNLCEKKKRARNRTVRVHRSHAGNGFTHILTLGTTQNNCLFASSTMNCQFDTNKTGNKTFIHFFLYIFLSLLLCFRSVFGAVAFTYGIFDRMFIKQSLAYSIFIYRYTL